jgi:putative hemolysin
MEHLASKGSKRAKTVLILLENPENFLSSVQVGITLIGIISGAYGWSAIAGVLSQYFQMIPFMADHAEWLALVVAIAGITYFSIVIGELVPKTLAMNHAEWLALFCVPILKYFMFITYPFVRLLSLSTALVVKILGIKNTGEETLNEEELISLLKTAGKDGVLDKEESQIHHNIFSFGDQTAKSMITHRNELEYVDIHDTTDEIFDKIKVSTHSKILVVDGTLDTVVGILRLRDFLENQNTPDFSLESIITKPIIVTEHTPAFKILNTFKHQKQYMAVVVDEFGGTEGIITLHDLMEVIIGNLPDEDEEEEESIIKRSESDYLVNGKTLIYELNQYFQEEVIEENNHEYTTVSWFIMNSIGHLPKTGEKVELENFTLEIIDMDSIRIDKVLLTRKQKTIEQE